MKEVPAPAVAVAAAGGGGNGGKVPAEEVWEVRPGGMLVQKRGGIGGGAGDDEPSPNVKPVPTIRVKVKHAGVTHEIYISSEASFGQSVSLSAPLVSLVRFRAGQANHLTKLLRRLAVCRGAEEAGGRQDGAAPGRPEGAVQGQGARLQGVPGHGRRQGPLQGGGGGGPRGPRAPPHRGAPQRTPREGRQGRRRRHRRGRQARPQGTYILAIHLHLSISIHPKIASFSEPDIESRTGD